MYIRMYVLYVQYVQCMLGEQIEKLCVCLYIGMYTCDHVHMNMEQPSYVHNNYVIAIKLYEKNTHVS